MGGGKGGMEMEKKRGQFVVYRSVTIAAGSLLLFTLVAMNRKR